MERMPVRYQRGGRSIDIIAANEFFSDQSTRAGAYMAYTCYTSGVFCTWETVMANPRNR